MVRQWPTINETHPCQGNKVGSVHCRTRRFPLHWPQLSDQGSYIRAAAGLEVATIKILGTWESTAYLRYVQLPRESLGPILSIISADNAVNAAVGTQLEGNLIALVLSTPLCLYLYIYTLKSVFPQP